MEWVLDVALLVGAGLTAGYIAGLIGLGGGVIFAPVLFFYFSGIGVAPSVVTPLTIGSSLLCTLVAAVSSTWFHYHEDAVLPHVAVPVGLASAVAIFLMTHLVTTQLWYDQRAFQIAFSLILVAVVIRMIMSSMRTRSPHAETKGARIRRQKSVLLLTGGAAGSVAAAAGVGGGIVLVPIYNRFLRLPMTRAAGTSSATIVLISLAGVLIYGIMGWGGGVPATAIGYVDARALLLALPAVATVRAGVWTAHHVNRRWLQWSFAAVALLVAVRMASEAFGA